MDKAKRIYESNIEKNNMISFKLSKSISSVGLIRLIVIIGMFISDYVLYKNNKINLAYMSTMIFLVIFLVLIFYHDILHKNKEKSDILLDINKKGIQRLNDEFKNFDDKGEEYLENKHSFANDLDIFGKNSLFQFINTTVTQGGRNRLADILKGNEEIDKNKILMRQEAVAELSKKIEWRQNIIVEGSLHKSSKVDLNLLSEWSKSEEKPGRVRMVIAFIFMLVTFSSVALVIKGILPINFILLDLIVNYLVIKVTCKGISNKIELFKSIKGTMKGYSKILKLIEDEEFESTYLKALREQLIVNSENEKNKVSCKVEMKKLSNILDWIGDRSYNAFYLLLNLFFFADIFLIISLDNWKTKNGAYLDKWMNVMHEFDALNSIANIPFEHDEWVLPEILLTNEVSGINIAHPLMGEKGVKNSFSLTGKQKTALITGSNMSGKSTFLRTVSMNLILSYIGAPVCAEKFSCGIMKVYTCMRTSDNLEENISSFYAEILRIKLLIEACKNKENVFFVLDEIFKGTNSKDRHVGATVLIKQLIQYGGVGLVSTHDLELCDLEKEDDRISNYNFREFYEGNEIKFDYILRKGKSETQNAIHLMKLAGIDID